MVDEKEIKEFPNKELLDDWLAGKEGVDSLQEWLDCLFPTDMTDNVIQALEEERGQNIDTIVELHYKELKDELLGDFEDIDGSPLDQLLKDGKKGDL